MAGEKSLSERIAALQRSSSPQPPNAKESSSSVPLRGQALREKIARFDAAGGVPLPKAGASFGLGAPVLTERRAMGGLVGNRIPSASRSYFPVSRSTSPTFRSSDSYSSRPTTPDSGSMDYPLDDHQTSLYPTTVSSDGPCSSEQGNLLPNSTMADTEESGVNSQSTALLDQTNPPALPYHDPQRYPLLDDSPCTSSDEPTNINPIDVTNISADVSIETSNQSIEIPTILLNAPSQSPPYCPDNLADPGPDDTRSNVARPNGMVHAVDSRRDAALSQSVTMTAPDAQTDEPRSPSDPRPNALTMSGGTEARRRASHEADDALLEPSATTLAPQCLHRAEEDDVVEERHSVFVSTDETNSPLPSGLQKDEASESIVSARASNDSIVLRSGEGVHSSQNCDVVGAEVEQSFERDLPELPELGDCIGSDAEPVGFPAVNEITQLPRSSVEVEEQGLAVLPSLHARPLPTPPVSISLNIAESVSVERSSSSSSDTSGSTVKAVLPLTGTGIALDAVTPSATDQPPRYPSVPNEHSPLKVGPTKRISSDSGHARFTSSNVLRSASLPTRRLSAIVQVPKARTSLLTPSLPSLFGDDEEDQNYVGGWAQVIVTTRRQ